MGLSGYLQRCLPDMFYILASYIFFPLLWVITRFNRSTTLKRVLVIQSFKIGDLICCTGVFREIKKAYPDVHLTVMVKPLTKGLLENNPNVDEIIYLDNALFGSTIGRLRLLRVMAAGSYDAVLSLNHRVQYALTPLWALIPIRISLVPDNPGFNFALASRLLTHTVRHLPGRMVIETQMEMLKHLGITSGSIKKEVYKSKNSSEAVEKFFTETGVDTKGCLLAGIGVSSGMQMKELGVKKVAAVADSLIEEYGTKVVLIGSPAEKDKAKEIMSLSRNRDGIIDSTGRFGLEELPALLERLSVYVGVDSGITYMADALDMPVVNICGPADMEDQRPVGTRAVLIRSSASCAPCSHCFRAPSQCATGTRKCIESVPVREIVDAAGLLIKDKFCQL